MNNIREMSLEEALEEGFFSLSDIPEHFFHQKEFILQVFPTCLEPVSWHDIPPELQKDRDVIIMSLQLNLVTLENLSDWLHDDELVLIAFATYPYNIEFMPDKWLNNREWIKSCLVEYGDLFANICDRYGSDLEMALIASESYTNTLVHVDVELTDNFELVKNCIENDMNMLKFASQRLNQHPDIIYSIINQLKPGSHSSISSFYFDKAVYSERLFMELAIDKDPSIYKNLSVELKSDLTFLLKAITYKHTDISFAPMNTLQLIAHRADVSLNDIIQYKLPIKDILNTLILYDKIEDELNQNNDKHYKKIKI